MSARLVKSEFDLGSVYLDMSADQTPKQWFADCVKGFFSDHGIFEHTHAYFPMEWYDPGVDWGEVDDIGIAPAHPLILRLVAGDDVEGTRLCFEIDLRECLADVVEACREDGSWVEGLEKISEALEEFSGEIKNAVQEGRLKDAEPA